MTELVFQIVPTQIPLGRTSDAKLFVSHTGSKALESIRGRLRYPASIQLLGLSYIDIPRIAEGEKVCIPIRIAGTLPGNFLITLTRLNARTETGSTLDFDDRDLAMNVLDQIEPSPHDVVLILEPAGSLVQNRIGQLRCTVHNNGSLPISSPQLTIAARHCDFYKGTNRPKESIPPGVSMQLESQVLPRLAGALTLSLHLQFSIQGQIFTRDETCTFTVHPSNQILPTYNEETQAIFLVTASPSGEEPIRVNKEFRNILLEMKHLAPRRERFQVNLLLAATLDDLSEAIHRQPPYLIHFAGHGTEYGIILEDVEGAKHVIRTSQLVNLLEPLESSLKCIILNACDSLSIAMELAQSLRDVYVVGMRQTQLDTTALSFSKGFYEAVGAGRPIEMAFQIARSELRRGPFDESLTPALFKNGKTI